jgi:hypothetical protein
MIRADTRVDRRRLPVLWFALLGGPAAWTAHLLASYPLVLVSCRAGTTLILHSVTAATLIVAASASLAGWLEWRRLGEGAAPAGGEEAIRYRRARFMAVAGALLSGFFALVTLAEGVPVLFGDPCLRGP